MRARPSRERSKAVAVIELAFSLMFLVPLMCAAVDFGYYFYVGSNAQEAARQGAQQAVRKSAGAACGSVQAIAAANIVQNVHPTTETGLLCLAGDVISAVYCYMNQAPLQMGATSGPTAVSDLTCDATPTANSWHIQVDVSFPLLLGFYKPLFPAGVVSGTVRYRAIDTA